MKSQKRFKIVNIIIYIILVLVIQFLTFGCDANPETTTSTVTTTTTVEPTTTTISLIGTWEGTYDITGGLGAPFNGTITYIYSNNNNFTGTNINSGTNITGNFTGTSTITGNSVTSNATSINSDGNTSTIVATGTLTDEITMTLSMTVTLYNSNGDLLGTQTGTITVTKQ